MNYQEKAIKRQKIHQIDLLQSEGNGNHIDSDKDLQEELQLKLAEEQIKWKQRAKQHWLKDGDRNTKFFHMHANQRRKTNSIRQIRGLNAELISDQLGISAIFSNFYPQLFTASHPSHIVECLQDMAAKVHDPMNCMLQQDFTE